MANQLHNGIELLANETFTIGPNVERSATISEHLVIGTEEGGEGDIELEEYSQRGSP